MAMQGGKEHDRVEEATPSRDRSLRHQEALDRFILFWGEMASNWGINRTMAQIHALLYCSEEPLDTDEIMEQLEISRGNANMNLRSLTSWNLVRKVHQPGSRKDFYMAEKDVWAITAQIIKERERREIRPVMEQLEECHGVLTGGEPCEALEEPERIFCERISNLMQLMEVFNAFSRVLLPMVEHRNVELMRQIVRFASVLGEDEPEEGP